MSSSMRLFNSDEVFGMTRDLPLNYISREYVDTALLHSLHRDKHIVIYGSSKQGKTSLRKKHFTNPQQIVIQCSNRWALSDLNKAILKHIGYEITTSETKTMSGKNRSVIKASAAFGVGLEGEKESENEETNERTTIPLDLDLTDVNDIIKFLKDEKMNIILEDFHYLPIETQKDFSVALKAFHEKSKICFIIIGVWLEEGRLTLYNGDLTGRLIGINADKWEKKDLMAVIEKGERILNIEFDSKFKNDLIENCFESVYIVQEVCYKVCMRNGIRETRNEKTVLGSDIYAKDIIKSVINEQSGRYNSFIQQYIVGFQSTHLNMHRWILLPVIISNISDLEDGLSLRRISRILQLNHPKRNELNRGNITQALQSSISLQIDKDIKPIILDYDQTNLKLNIVDRSFLIWLDNQDKNDLLDLADLPSMDKISYDETFSV